MFIGNCFEENCQITFSIQSCFNNEILNFSTGKSPGSTLFPSTGPPPGTAEDIAASLSPLQRMASITNSLVTQPPLTGGGGHGNRPMRAILPPITQQQFDQFSHLNTDETVRRVCFWLLIIVSKVSKLNETSYNFKDLLIINLLFLD